MGSCNILSRSNIILNVVVSFCRFPMQELCLSFALTNEKMLIQNQNIFEIRLLVVNVLIRIRVQYRYDIKCIL